MPDLSGDTAVSTGSSTEIGQRIGEHFAEHGCQRGDRLPIRGARAIDGAIEDDGGWKGQAWGSGDQ
jgi:NAD(P)-dependent dehydrogenase (short-subunit alcohol dehydrogenase family)